MTSDAQRRGAPLCLIAAVVALAAAVVTVAAALTVFA